MNSPPNINPHLDPTKGFWDRHPYLRGLTKLLPSLATIESATIAFLNYIGYSVSTNILFMVIGIPIAAFLIALNKIYILDQRAGIKALREEIARKENEILSINDEIAQRMRTSANKDKQISFLKNRLHPNERKLVDLVLNFAVALDPKNPEGFGFMLQALWEIVSRDDLKEL